MTYATCIMHARMDGKDERPDFWLRDRIFRNSTTSLVFRLWSVCDGKGKELDLGRRLSYEDWRNKVVIEQRRVNISVIYLKGQERSVAASRNY